MRENHAKKHMLDYKYTKNNIPITTPSLKSVYQTNAWQSNLRCMVWSLIIASRSCRWVAVNNSFISDNSLLRLKLFGIFTYDFHVVFVVSSFKLKKNKSLDTRPMLYTPSRMHHHLGWHVQLVIAQGNRRARILCEKVANVFLCSGAKIPKQERC